MDVLEEFGCLGGATQVDQDVCLFGRDMGEDGGLSASRAAALAFS